MAYGLNDRLFIEDGPAIHASGVRARRSSIWRSLGPERRLALVNRALDRSANTIDGLPIAL